MAGTNSMFEGQSNVICGTGDYTCVVASTGRYNVKVRSTELPPSALSIVIKQDSTTKATSTAPTSGQSAITVEADMMCAAADTVHVVISGTAGVVPVAAVAAVATLDTTASVILTSAATGASRNTQTLTLVYEAAAANPTSTVLATFTGTAAAITLTVTPNDGTNNGATAVDLTNAQIAELINAGTVAGKTITLTDASARRILQTATGGDGTTVTTASHLGTFASGVTAVAAVTSTDDSANGVRSIVTINKMS